MAKITDVEKRFFKAAKKAGMKVVMLKPSHKKCFYCSLGSPDFEMNGKPFHIECLPNKACTRLETGGTKSDSESKPAISSG